MTTQHARFAPSKMARLIACPGSYDLCANLPPEPETEAAREGTLAHLVAEAVYNCNPIPDGATDEMTEGAELYVRTIRQFCPHGAYLESRADCSTLHPDCWGTVDAWAHAVSGVHVFDYKFGHRAVEAVENWQLLTYAIGLTSRLQLPDAFPVSLHIIQPRAYVPGGPVRTWTTRAADLAPYAERIRRTLADIDTGAARCTPGEQCAYCPGRAVCPALQSAGWQAMELAAEPVPMELPPAALGLELEWAERSAALLSHRLDALRAMAEHALREGQSVPGWSMAPSSGREKWDAAPADVFALGDLLGVELRKAAEPITPAQARKVLPDASLLAGMTSKPSTFKLTRAPRTEHVFKEVTE